VASFVKKMADDTTATLVATVAVAKNSDEGEDDDAVGPLIQPSVAILRTRQGHLRAAQVTALQANLYAATQPGQLHLQIQTLYMEREIKLLRSGEAHRTTVAHAAELEPQRNCIVPLLPAAHGDFRMQHQQFVNALAPQLQLQQ
jgi:hypothetical protein